uniref:P-type domain-containing protein n=1 Tax=Lepeophtheirus salmonis TaxID=72036 RepID=A0A0K2T9D7_LEPSM
MSAYELYPSKGTSTGITIPQKTYLNIKPSGRVKLIRLKNVNFGECAFYFQTFDPYGYLSNQVSTFFSYVPKGRLCYLGEAKQDKTMIHMVESKGTITGTKTGTYKMDGVVQEGISHELGDDDYGENLNSLCLVPEDLKISCSDDYKIKKADCARKNCCFNPDHPIKCYYEFDVKANSLECIGMNCKSHCYNGQALYSMYSLLRVIYFLNGCKKCLFHRAFILPRPF